MSKDLATRLDLVKPSATLAMTALAADLKASGKTVYPFGVGQPDFQTPDYILAAVRDNLPSYSGYTPATGTVALKEAISESTLRDRGWEPKVDQITVGVGAKHVLFYLMLVLLNPGDEVIIPAPYWVSYPEQVRLFGGEPIFIDAPPSAGFRITPEQLKAALTPKTKAIILCSPSNPTGAAYTESQLKALVEVLADSDCYIIADEIYGELVYDGFQHVSLGKLAPEFSERLIVVDGVSKAYAMTGWRIGWATAPKAVTRGMAKLQGQSTTNPSAVAQAAATAAVLGPRDDVERMRQAFASRRKTMVDGLNAIEGISCEMPDGAFYAFPDVRGLYGIQHDGKPIETAKGVALWQLDACGVAAVAGEAFGAPGHIRFSYAASDELIREALGTLTEAVRTANR